MEDMSYIVLGTGAMNKFFAPMAVSGMPLLLIPVFQLGNWLLSQFPNLETFLYKLLCNRDQCDFLETKRKARLRTELVYAADQLLLSQTFLQICNHRINYNHKLIIHKINQNHKKESFTNQYRSHIHIGKK